MKKLILIVFAVLVLYACSKDPDIDDTMLDSGLYFDQSLYKPEKYLLSVSNPNPTAAEALKPVIIAIHGYGATTFEWDEFRTWTNDRADYSISQVLLGGHGRDYQSFKGSTWEDWQKPIKDEYEKLVQQGYKNISFAGSSTGSTLILEMLGIGYFNSRVKPKHIFLIDPIIVPSNKMLSLAALIGPIIGYTTVDNTSGEEKYYYHYRPHETLNELRKVINLARNYLENGIQLPAGSTLKVFKSEKDDVADPVSAVLIYKGIRSSTGDHIPVSMVPSNLHVFTRLNLRSNTPSAKDFQNQTNTFQEIANTLVE